MNNLPPTPQPLPHPHPFGSTELALAHPPAALAMPEAASRDAVLRHYWRILHKRRLIIAAITAVCMILAVVLSMLTQRQYASTVTIQVARETSKVLNIEGVEQESTDSYYSDEFYQTQYSLLKTLSLSEAVARDLKLADNFLFLANFEPSRVDDVKQIPRAERFEMAAGIVNANTIVDPVRMSSIINVRFNSPNPRTAMQVANAIAENFIEANLTRRFEAATYARQFLQNRLNQVRLRLEESERKAVETAQSQGLIKIRSGNGESVNEQSLVSSNLAELSSQLSIARAQRAAAEARFRAGTGGSIAAQSLSNPTINALEQQRSELTAQLDKLQTNFGPEYPSVAALRSQIASIDRQLGAQRGRVGSNVAGDLGGRYREALATERALQAKVEGLKADLLSEQRRSIESEITERDVEKNRALYDALLQRFKEIGVAGGIGTNNISIADRARLPGAPFKPNLRLNLMLGLLLGLLLGGLTAFLLEQLEEAAVLPADFQRKLGIQLLGATPKLEATTDVQQALLEPKSSLSEAYFSILTSIQFSTPHGAPTSLMLTSAQAREGKSTTAVALAQALAGVGARVLLIDADMRNPSLHKLLGRPLGSGLSNLLTGSGELDDHIEESQTPNLSVLMAGAIPPNPAELLSTEAIDRLITAAVGKFDHVVIDGPPILGLADAPLLARAVEATVLVVEAGRTRATQARHAIERLLAVRATVIGAVLSKFDLRSGNYGYGYGYGYGYNYDYMYSYGAR